MTHRDFRRRLIVDGLAVALLLIFAVAARQSAKALAPVLPGGAGLWLAIAVTFVALGTLVAWVACRSVRKVDELLDEIAQSRHTAADDLLDTIKQIGAEADAVIFDFDVPQERPRLTLIAGGRDMGEGAA